MVLIALTVVGGYFAVKGIKDHREKKKARRQQERGAVEYNERFYEKADAPPEYSFHPNGGASGASSMYSREQHAI